MIFYLGTHMANWLWNGEVDVPLFISRRRITRIKNLKEAKTDWCLDSGGFTELNMYGEWRTTEDEYIKEVRRFMQIGRMNWCAPQDWMCEPEVLKKTGKTVEEHQLLTVRNYLSLREKAPDIPVIPVLQGWLIEDYTKHWELYEKHGVHLEDLPTVGVGTVCRRQRHKEGVEIIKSLQPLKLHGFGFKRSGLKFCCNDLVSADSMAWSFVARVERVKLVGCSHNNCGNCVKWALLWRERMVKSYKSYLHYPEQPSLQQAIQFLRSVEGASDKSLFFALKLLESSDNLSKRIE